MRDMLIAKYPEVMATENIGYMPNNALYHAEATVPMRAAQAQGGNLGGGTIDIFVDREICRNCSEILPLVVREIGNPTINFRDSKGDAITLRNGAWSTDRSK